MAGCSRSKDSLSEAKTEKNSAKELSISITASFMPPAPSVNSVVDSDICKPKEKKAAHENTLKPDGLAGVIVWLEGSEVQPWSKNSKDAPSSDLIEEGCELSPHILIVPPGGVVTFINRDPILHGLRSISRANPPFYRVHPPNQTSFQIRFQEPEILQIIDDIHPAMKSYIVVAAHPDYRVTDESGSVSFKKLKAGTYRVHLWHEVFGTKILNEPVVLEKPTQQLSFHWDYDSNR